MPRPALYHTAAAGGSGAATAAPSRAYGYPAPLVAAALLAGACVGMLAPPTALFAPAIHSQPAAAAAAAATGWVAHPPPARQQPASLPPTPFVARSRRAVPAPPPAAAAPALGSAGSVATLLLLGVGSLLAATAARALGIQRRRAPLAGCQPLLMGMASTTGEATGIPTPTPTSRPSPEGLAYDERLVAERPELVLAHLRARQYDMAVGQASVDRIKEIVAERGALTRKKDDALSQRKKLSGQIGQLMRTANSADPETKRTQLLMIDKLKETVEEVTEIADSTEKDLDAKQKECEELFAALPNLLQDRTPYGASEEENEVVSEWGTELRKVGEGYRWHDELAIGLGGYQPEAAAKIAGSRFAVLAGGVARLERALAQFMLDTHVQQHGYQEMAVPLFAGRNILEGTGQLPKFEADLFKVSHEINGQDAFLIPTAEVPLTNLFADTILEASALPISLCALTQCFRAEAGGYGRDTRGLIRQHQFQKVELVKVTTAEDVVKEHELLTSHAEAILRLLQLPYRKIRLCSGDIGFSARECFDLEVWLPGQQTYREISSCSNCGDFQARRMKLRYRPTPTPAAPGEKPKKPGTVFACTINGSGLAVGRTLVAVLENYQQPDGSVAVPEALRPYMNGLEVLRTAV